MRIAHLISSTKYPEEFGYVSGAFIDAINRVGADESFVIDLKDVESAITLVKTLNARSVDILNVYGREGLNLAQSAAMLSGKKFFVTIFEKSEFGTTLGMAGILSKRVIVPSKCMYDHILESNKLLKDKIRIIPFGVEINHPISEMEKSLVRERLGLKKDSLVMGNVGNFIAENDQITLIKSFRKIIQKEVNAELVFYGEGDGQDIIERILEDYKIKDLVKIVNPKSEKLSFFQIAEIFDIYIHSSFNLNKTPIVISKILAHGKPVIATKVAGNPELIKEGEIGFLVPCGFPERIESAIMKLVVNKGMIDQFGRNALNYAKDNLELDKVVMNYKQVLAS